MSSLQPKIKMICLIVFDTHGFKNLGPDPLCEKLGA